MGDDRLFDCSKLFPADLDPNHVSLDPDTRRWLSKSVFTVSAVGLASKFWLQCANKVQIYNGEILKEALEQRPSDVPLITVANHHSCMDEPLLWGILNVRQLTNQRLMRWSLAAHDICFTKRLHSLFFSLGKCIPICRGSGVFQPGMDFTIDRLNEGSWVHLFPEGKVNEEKIDIRFKWGVGRLISESRNPPIVIPIYHQGMDSILPNREPYWPRMFKKVTVVVGNPIPMEPVLAELKSRGADAEEQRRVITDVIQTQLYKLRLVSEVLHARHLSGGVLSGQLPFKMTPPPPPSSSSSSK